MTYRFASRILIANLFLALFMFGTSLWAQAPHMPMGNSPQKSTTPTTNQNQQNHAAANNNPSCQKIVQECKNLGFIVGEWKQDNGLWKDCYSPVVHGGQATRDGKPIQVPVSQSDIQACRGAGGGQRNMNANKTPAH